MLGMIDIKVFQMLSILDKGIMLRARRNQRDHVRLQRKYLIPQFQSSLPLYNDKNLIPCMRVASDVPGPIHIVISNRYSRHETVRQNILRPQIAPRRIRVGQDFLEAFYIGCHRPSSLMDSVIRYFASAAARSRYRVAPGCIRRTVAGHSSVIGPNSVALTAAVLVGPGTTQNIQGAIVNAGMVNVRACFGTCSNVGKHPSWTCWTRLRSSRSTSLTSSGSSKSATSGSLNAICPFSPMPRQTISGGMARKS